MGVTTVINEPFEIKKLNFFCERKRDDHGLRCWLLELIAAARSPAAVPVLAAQLESRDESRRGRAAAALERLGTREARTLLWRASANGT